jgi:hypothetical protein
MRACFLSLLVGVNAYYLIFLEGFFEGFLSLLDGVDFKHVS